MSSISFDNVYLLLIAIPLLAALCVPFFIAIKKENRNGHNIASMVLHVLMAVIIAFAAAGTQIVTVITQTNVYVLADVSYSANKNLDTVDGYIQELSKNLPKNSKMGVICFGKDCEKLTELGGKLKSVKTSEVDDSETNIAEALVYAGGLFKDNVIKRIVVITDGRQTYSGDSNELKRTVSELQGQGIHVDAIYLDDALSGTAKEIQVSGAEYTNTTYLNHKEEVSVTIESSFATRNTVVDIYRNGEKIDSKTRDFSLGVSNISFALDTSETGVFDYEIKITDPADESNLNNTYSFAQKVSGEVKVLLIASDSKDRDYVNEIYGENAEIDAYIKDENMPYTLEDLCEYDEIVLSSVDLTEIIPYRYEAFVQNLDTAVSVFGKNLVTFGNMAIQDKADNTLKQLDGMLPVNFGDAVDEPKLFTIVLDVSYSMNMWARMILAKQAASQLLKTLSDEDYVSIVAFSGSTEQALNPTSLRNRDTVQNFIDGLKFEQGTVISAGIDKAFSMIRGLKYSEKQVMLITDGISYVSYDDGSDDTSKELQGANATVQQMRALGIYTSVIVVGGGNSEDNRNAMKNISRLGGGSYLWCVNEDYINAVVFDAIVKDDSDAEITDVSGIYLSKPRDVIIAGDEDGNLENAGFASDTQYVEYYVLSKAKSSATTVLSVNYEYKNSDGGWTDIDVPLFAYWNYGNGKVETYTGKLNGIYERGDTLSATNNPFFKNVLTGGVPQEKIDCPFTVVKELDGKSAIIQLIPAEIRSKATAEMTVTSPSGAQSQYTLTFDTRNYYQQFRASEIGRYHITLTYSYGGTDYAAETYLNVSYEPEYDEFAVYDAAVLYKMLGGNGTVSLDGKLAIENDENEQETFVLHLTLPLAVTAVILFVADVIIRKLKWKDIVSLFGKGREKVKNKDKGKK